VGQGSGTQEAGRRCVEALRAGQAAIGPALDGRSLLVLVAEEGEVPLRMVLTRSGVVGLVPDDQAFEPQVELRGSAAAVGAFLRQRTSLADAVLAGVAVIRMPEDEVAGLRPLRDVVADILEELDRQSEG